eukprot:scaffold8287_cov267-Pinguiococcus_pyrenoidosus.AAC.2
MANLCEYSFKTSRTEGREGNFNRPLVPAIFRPSKRTKSERSEWGLSPFDATRPLVTDAGVRVASLVRHLRREGPLARRKDGAQAAIPAAHADPGVVSRPRERRIVSEADEEGDLAEPGGRAASTDLGRDFRSVSSPLTSLSASQEDAPLKRTPRPSSRKRPRKQAPEAEDYLSAKQRRCKAPQRLMQELEEREFERQLSKAMEASKTAPPAVKPEEPPEDSARAPARVKPEKAASRPKSPSRPWSRPAGPQLKTETGKAKPEKAQARRKKRSSIHFDSYKFDWTQAVPHRHYVGVAELYERFVAFAWIRGRREVLGWFDTSVEAAVRVSAFKRRQSTPNSHGRLCMRRLSSAVACAQLAYDEAMTARYGDNAEKNFTSFLDEKGNRLPEFARGVHR